MLGMLRLINPPGHKRTRPFPSYATSNPVKKPVKRARRAAKAMRDLSDLYPGKPKSSGLFKNPSLRALAAKKGRALKARGPRKLTGAALMAHLKKIAANPARKANNKTASSAASGGSAMRKLYGAAKAAHAKKVAKKARRNPAKRKKARRNPGRSGAMRITKADLAKFAALHAPASTKPKASKAAPKKAKRAKKARRGYHVTLRTVSKKTGKRVTRRVKPSHVLAIRTAKKRKPRKYGVAIHTVSRRTKKGLKRVRRPGLFRAYKNPDFKSMLMNGGMLWAGVTGMKVLSNLLEKYALGNIAMFKNAAAGSMTAKLGKMLPSVAIFGLAAFADKLVKGQPKMVAAVQTGATINLLNAAFTAFVKPMVDANASLAPIFQGVGEYLPMQGLGGGYGEYLQQQQMLGAHVQEPLALDEYVDGFGGGGFDVEEALADSEASGLQSGYAGGSLARTVFSV